MERVPSAVLMPSCFKPLYLSFLLSFITSFLSSSAYAVDFINSGPPFINIEKIGQHELSNVSAIMEDSQGFIWMVNDSGLLRYDGNDIKRFPGLEQFTSPDVNVLVEGQPGQLWIGTLAQGLALFDTRSETLTFYDLTQHFSIESAVGDNNTRVDALVYKNNHLYLASQNQIIVIDETNLSVQQQVSLPLLESDNIVRLMVSSNGDIWASGNQSNGVFRFDKNGLHRFEHQADNETTISAKLVWNIVEDRTGRIWFGTLVGLDLFLPETENFKRYMPIDLTTESNKHRGTTAKIVSNIAEDQEGNLWLGLYRAGIIKFQPDTETFEHYPHLNSIRSTILTDDLSNTSSAILIDQQQVLWALTAKGISKLPLNSRKVSQWANIDKDNCTAHHLHETKQGVLFSCDKDLYRINDNHLSFIETFGKRIYSIFEGQDNNIWLGTIGGGIYRYDVTTGSTQHYGFTSNSDQLKANIIKQLRADGDGNLYGLSLKHPREIGYGIVRYDPDNDKFHNYATGLKFTDYIDVNKSKLMLFRSFTNAQENLYWFDKNNQTLEQLPINTGKVYAALKWHQQLWISTQQLGLIRMDIDSGQWHQLKAADRITGLYLDSSTESLYLDSKKHLHLLESVNKRQIQTRCITCSLTLNYSYLNDEEYGQLYRNRALLMNGGQFWISTENNLLSFPVELADAPASSQLMLTDYQVMGSSVSPSQNDKSPLLAQSIGLTNSIGIPPETTFFSLSFAKVGAAWPEQVRYAYKMDGLNKDWIHTDASHPQADYSLLPPGSYRFNVKSTDDSGHWQEGDRPLSLAIIVHPPWWQTWWAYSFYLLCIFGLLWLFYRMKLAEKERQSALELATAKEQLFANLSHEFRTPLTLILGPAKVIREQMIDATTQHNLSLIERNAQRLLSMVEQLLQLAQLKEQQKDQSDVIQVAAICHLVMQTCDVIAREKKITLKLEDAIDESWWVAGTQDGLETILYNLLTNAVKYTKTQGIISLEVIDRGQQIEFKVSDTGCGIAPHEQNKVFERFTRLALSQDSVPGAGIGLALVKELVNTLGGQISVKSQLNEGSTFIFTLPKAMSPELPANNVSDAHSASPLQQETQQPDAQFHLPTTVADSDIHKAHEMSVGAVVDMGSQEQVEVKVQELAKPSVLIVEDNHEMREFIRDRLKPHYQILEATHGEQGLTLALEHSPDIIISDVMMPGMDGFQLLSKIRNEMAISHIPVILLTAKGDQQSKLKGLSDLADDYITKPFDPQELLLRIQGLLGIRSLLQDRFDKSVLQPAIDNIIETKSDTEATPHDPDALTDKEQQFYLRFKEIVEQSYSDPELSLIQVSAQMAMSDRQLQRKLKAISGISFNEILRNYRLTQGCQLLNSDLQIALIADRVGFNSSSYFVRCFKAKYGKTPNEYRKGSE